MRSETGRDELAVLIENLVVEVERLAEASAQREERRCCVCNADHSADPNLHHPSSKQMRQLWAAMRGTAES